MNQIAINLQDQLDSNQNLLITHQTSLRTAKEIKQKFLNMNVKIPKKYRLDNNTPIYGLENIKLAMKHMDIMKIIRAIVLVNTM